MGFIKRACRDFIAKECNSDFKLIRKWPTPKRTWNSQGSLIKTTAVFCGPHCDPHLREDCNMNSNPGNGEKLTLEAKDLPVWS